MIGLTAGLALEARRHGILVNAVMPNAITAMAVEATETAPIPRLEENERFLTSYGAVAEYLEPARAAALVAYLASPECQVTGEVLSQVGPRFSRVFLGVTRGWMSSSEIPAPEEIAAHLDEIRALEGVSVPIEVAEDFEHAAQRLRAGA
jgi:NAD(P)-dependent dehydrogenase (short-subunit alcohol dehydrogenase family)